VLVDTQHRWRGRGGVLLVIVPRLPPPAPKRSGLHELICWRLCFQFSHMQGLLRRVLAWSKQHEAIRNRARMCSVRSCQQNLVLISFGIRSDSCSSSDSYEVNKLTTS
jgi:hypothetical protein